MNNNSARDLPSQGADVPSTEERQSESAAQDDGTVGRIRRFVGSAIHRHRLLLLHFSLILAILVAFYGTLLFALGGYINWANFVVPYSAQQFRPWAFVWNPYVLNGTPTFLPPATLIFEVIETLPLVGLSWLFGLDTALKLYILFSTFFMIVAFYYLCRTWGVGPNATLVASLFFGFSPVQLRFVAGGDFLQFLCLGFVFLSLAFLLRFIQTGMSRPHFLLGSIVALALSFGSVQLTVLGTGLYFAVGVYACFLTSRWKLRPSLGALGRFALGSLILVPVFAFIYLPLVFGGSSYTVANLTAVPLTTFTHSSASFWSMLNLSAFTPTTAWDGVQTTFGSGFLAVWEFFEGLLLIALIVSVAFLRTSRQLFGAIVVLFSAALGAGPSGPLGGLSSYLYVHLPGYTALNQPWFWLMGPISTFFALMLGVLLDAFLSPTSASPSTPRADRPKWRFGLSRPLGGRTTRFVLCSVTVIVVALVIVPPVASQAYYRTDNSVTYGIASDPLPSDYTTMYATVRALTGPSQTGVGFFTPDVFAYLHGSSDRFDNPFVQIPEVRTAGLPFYGAPAVASNYYYYWLYELFYANGTRYLADLMGLEGTSVFVNLYGTNPTPGQPPMPWGVGINASSLLAYQQGVSLVAAGQNYGIFTSSYSVPAASPYASTTMVLGDYNSLNRMAYEGWNLTRQAVEFPTDVPTGSVASQMSNLTAIDLHLPTDLVAIALAASDATSVNPLQYASGLGEPASGWSNSRRELDYPQINSAPAPFAFTTTRSTLTIPATESSYGSNQIWADIYHGPEAKDLVFSANGQTVNVPAHSPFAGQYNTFVWTPVNLSVPPNGGALTIKSNGGWGAIEGLYFSNAAAVDQALAAVYGDIQSSRMPVVLSEDPSEVQVVGGSVTDVNDSGGETPGAEYVDIGSTPSSNASFQVDVPALGIPGYLWFLVGSRSSGMLNVSFNGTGTLTQLHPSRTGSPSKWTWYRYGPIEGSSLPVPVNVTATGPGVLVGDILYAPAAVTVSSDLGSDNVTQTPPISGSLGGVIPVQVPLSYQASGYRVTAGCDGTNVLVRSSYLPNLKPSGGGAFTYPLMGGSVTGVSRPGGCGTVALVAQAWNYLLLGSAISVASAVALWFLLPVMFVRRTKRHIAPTSAPAGETIPEEHQGMTAPSNAPTAPQVTDT